MSFNDDFLNRQADPTNLGAIVLRQSATMQQIGQGFVRVNSLDEIAGAIGELQYRAADADGKVRMVMSAVNLLDEFGVNAHLAGFNTNGVPQFWASSDDGSLNSGGGTVKMDTDGITINNVGSALQIGTNGSRIELLVNGQGIAKLIYYNMDGTELILNGTFESGSLSDWTTVSGSPVVQSTTFKHGAYALKFTATGAATTEIETNAYINVIADRWYVLQAWGQYTNAASSARIFIDWYTSGSVLISTSQINLNQTAPIFTRSIEGVYSPATAAKVKIRIRFAQSVADTCYLDTVSFQKTIDNSYGEFIINDPNKKQFSFMGKLGMGLYDQNSTLLWEGGTALAEVNTNDIFQVSSPGGVSAFVGTINGAPSGTLVGYNVTSGQEGAMVPVSTGQLAKLRLYNTTRGNSALISNCNTATNTITLTATAPANWASGDTITIASQTVSGGGFSWIDLELTSGPINKGSLFMKLQFISATVGDALRIHPFDATHSSAKYDVLIALVASQASNGLGLIKITNNVFSIAWTGTPSTVLLRESGQST